MFQLVHILNFRPIGSDIKKGERVLSVGCLVGSAEIGILAQVGREKVEVFDRPEIAILSTGDELVHFATKRPLPFGKVRDSNSVQLKVLLEQAGFPVKTMANVLDKLISFWIYQ